MGWKKKEKQLSAEEAVELAKIELAPYWIGTPPLFAGTLTDGKASAYPLNPEVLKQNWIYIFIDPSTMGGESSLIYLKELHKRYQEHSLRMIIILKRCYSYFKNGPLLVQWVKKMQIPIPVAYDVDGTLCGAFAAENTPKIAIYVQGKSIFQNNERDCFAAPEIRIQHMLREKDPGLPLFPVSQAKGPSLVDVGILELGAAAASVHKARFPMPGFKPTSNGYGAALFAADSARSAESLERGMVKLTGTWIQDAERIATQDPKATLEFEAQGAFVSVNAQSLNGEKKQARVYIEFNHSQVFDAVAGDSLSFDEEGKSLVRFESGSLYSLLRSLPQGDRRITLRFPYADRVAVALYGIREGDSS